MPKINQEEYEVLKGLDDKWEWIARDKDGTLVMGAGKNGRYLDGWFPPVNVGDSLVVDETNAVKDVSEYGNLFQFIQWEDESPYNIQGLIEEYLYDNQPKLFIDGQEQSFEFIEESEEKEVKKQKLIEKWESAIEAAEFYGKGKEDRLIEYMRNFVDDLNQLDEPEVLSQEWLDENKEMYLINDTSENAVPDYKLQNLLVPKPEVLSQEFIDEQRELETKIQELIESYKQEEGAYSNPENGWISGFIEDLKNLVEEEQKYYVDLDTAAYVAKWNGNGQVDIYTDGISGSDEFEFHLTEQEIKDYDERFWPFAVKVEEVE